MEKLISNVDEIYLAALERQATEERSAYLEDACAGNPELRRRVQRLLEVQQKVGSFLESPAPEICPTVDHPTSERPGTIIGLYKLRELLGEGGMGNVYVAEQEEPLRRKVALKIIKPGMDSRQVLARFEAERQALAMMDHPHIAKVLDAGTTDSGRPYFVMELVRGVPITEFCDQRRLTPRQRLELFVQVCRAIQHAHQKGIIHRDIKPSNILVTLHDDLAVPKVIDFGVAKATGQRLSEQTVYTTFHQLIGTPLYMSPEQAEMNALDVDTRSDVYSLGVLLYELLSGSTPFDEDTFRHASFDEMRRLIREVDPPRPSQRVSTLGAEAASTASKSRDVDERRLHRALRGDLDWIVMKALEKDRNRRYESASALAADVQRHLDNEPIRAKQPRFFVSARKWCRRHRTATSSAAVAVVLLLMFATGMAADRHRQLRETSRFVEISIQAARTALEADDVQQAAQRLSEAQTRIDASQLADQALVGEVATLLQETERYAKFVPLFEQARGNCSAEGDEIAAAEEALTLYRVKEEPNWLDALRTFPKAHVKRITEAAYELLLLKADDLVRWSSQWPKATRQARLEIQCRDAVEHLEKAKSFHAPSRGYYWLMANCSFYMGDKEKEERLRATALKTPPHDAAELFYINRDHEWGTVSNNRGWPAHANDPGYSIEASLKDHREMLRLDPTYFNGLSFMAIRLSEKGRHNEALVAYYGCVARHPNYGILKMNRGITHARLGHFDEAKADFEAALAARPNSPTLLGMVAWNLATDPSQEMRDGARALELAQKACKLTDYKKAEWIDALAAAYAETGDFKSAVKWSEAAVELSNEYKDWIHDPFVEHLNCFREGKPWRKKE